MSPSPADPTPYEVLGVPRDVDDDALKSAYRRALRRSHPDTGGSDAQFTAVQRAWAVIGDPELRRRYDGGTGQASPSGTARFTGTEAGATAAPGGYGPAAGGTGAGASGRSGSVRARSYGHPGGLSRERYLAALREWVGLGDPIPDPYDPALVHSAPPAVRRLLAEALAEESTARIVSGLGIGFTVWNDVAVDRELEKIDHVVLGPAGLFALNSQDFGAGVSLSRGELVGDAVGDEKPLRTLTRASRALGRSVGVRFTGSLIVVPDDALELPLDLIARGRGAGSGVLRSSALPMVLRNGVRPGERLSIEDAFDVRTRLQNGLRLL
ncbi:J domain-containing protein [Mycetocola reblochoni]|uniref:DnaJ-class molecular chaperone CbpA n=2 Tax=Mycetocola reblochoni TaxID=331618 RepID=A0A1R4JNC4_9MICO|nr:J domain-containing protein [Mycetocola reblochoni]RLP68613.1 heat-shock protein [Mycetocola reblochoni]SJN33550.1 DnaJ-class molecular chaperone CbpA [Mycetocola reblochoni REB411]